MRTMRQMVGVGVLAITMGAIVSGQSDAGQLGKLVARGATRAAVRRAGPSMTKVLARDLRNHGQATVKKLATPRTVFRYTSRDVARQEVKRGIAPYRHMTSRAGAGRPASGGAAAKRFGLPSLPNARETVTIPRGQPVILNKAQGGRPGTGEIVSTRRIPKDSIVRVIPLRQ